MIQMSRYLLCMHVWHRENVFIRLYAIGHKVFISWQWWRRVCALVSEQKCNQSISRIHHVHECLLKDHPNELSIPFINNISCSKCSPVTLARCRWFQKPGLIISWFILFQWCGRKTQRQNDKHNKLQRKMDRMVAKNVSVNKIVVGKERNQGVRHEYTQQKLSVFEKNGPVNSGHQDFVT